MNNIIFLYIKATIIFFLINKLVKKYICKIKFRKGYESFLYHWLIKVIKNIKSRILMNYRFFYIFKIKLCSVLKIKNLQCKRQNKIIMHMKKQTKLSLKNHSNLYSHLFHFYNIANKYKFHPIVFHY